MKLKLTPARIVAVIASVAAVAALTGCGGSDTSSGSDSNVVRQGIYTSRLPLDLPVIVAEDQGFFKKHGVTVETTDIQTGTDMVTAIISNSIDVGNPASPPAIKVMTEQKADIGALAGGSVLDFRILVPTKSQLPPETADLKTRVETLKGKTVMVIGTGTLTDWWFRDVLKQAGMDPKSLTIIAANNAPGQIAAFQAGKVDAIVAFGTVPGLLGTAGTDYNVLLGIPEGQTGDLYTNTLQVFMAATHTWQKKNPDTVKDYCGAIADAVAWLTDKANRAAAVDAMAKWTKLDSDKAEVLLDATTYRMRLDDASWKAQGATVGDSGSLNFANDVNPACNDLFKS